MVCNHRYNWIVGGGTGLWCYVCGAYRGMESPYGGALVPRTPWIKPSGNKLDNPTQKLQHKVRQSKLEK